MSRAIFARNSRYFISTKK